VSERDAPSERAVESERDVVIVANGGANIASLQFALQRLNVESLVSADPERIRGPVTSSCPVWAPQPTR